MARVQSPAIEAASGPLPMQAMLVYTRAAWDGDWELRDYLLAQGAVRYAVQPVGSRAQLAYDFGMWRQHDALSFAEWTAPDLVGHYVRFDAETHYRSGMQALFGPDPVPLPFYGVVAEETLEVEAPFEDGGTVTPTGTALYSVYGLEYLLRVPVVSATAVQNGAEVELRVHPTFNRRYGRGGTVLGNRTSEPRPSGVHAFDHPDEWWTALWTASDVVRYLLYHHAPTDDGLTWKLGGQTDVLDQIEQVYRLPVGVRLDQVLNALIDRRRGLTWIPRTDGGTIEIHVSGVYDRAISVHGTTLQPNPEVARIEIDTEDAIDSHLVAACALKRSSSHHYGRFEVLGEPVKACFTAAMADSTLEAGWTAAQELLVRNALGDDPAENDLYRKRPHLAGVFTRFRLPASFEWIVGDGEGGSISAVANPLIGDDGTIRTGEVAPYWNANKRLLNWVPIEDPTREAAGSPPEYGRPFAFAKDPATGRFVLAHAHGIKGVAAAGLRMSDHEMGFELVAPYAQLFGRGHWSGAGASHFRGGLAGAGDYFAYETLGATVCCETDQRLRVYVDADEEPAAGPSRTLSVAVRGAELWYVAINTVTGIDDDGGLLHHEGGTVRDDRDRLTLVAALLKAWYGRPRSALRYTVRELAPVAQPGALVEAVLSNGWTEPVGTLCTSIEWDAEKGTTTIETAFWDLDFARVAFDAVGIPDAKAAARELRDLWQAVNDLEDIE